MLETSLTTSLLTFFISALGLGLLHAFDSDHLLAVANLMAQKKGYRKALGYSFHWAMGHALVLIFLGLYASYLGLNLPMFVSHWAEYLVGIMLIVLGAWTIYQVLYETPREYVFQHGQGNAQRHQPVKRSPILVGIIHGSAGSAPVLALIPAIQLQQPVITLSYMLFFALGVLLSMSLFALAFSRSQQHLENHHHTGFRVIRLFLGIMAIGLGAFWLV